MGTPTLELVQQPWPHLEFSGALGDPLAVLATWPKSGWTTGRLYRKFQMIPDGPLRNELFALGSRMCAALGVEGRYPVALLVEDETGYRIRRHTDVAQKVLSSQIYLAERPDREHYGVWLLDEPARQIPYRLNYGYAFARSSDTWHEVKPCDGPRKSIQLIYYSTDNPVL